MTRSSPHAGAYASSHRRHNSGQDRGHQHGDVDLREQAVVIEPERADEEAHGEADAGQDGDPVELERGGTRGPLPDTELERRERRAEHADLLAREQSRDDAERKRRREARERSSRQRHARIGERKQRNDAVAHPRL
jgi:hypothetical protein